MRNVSALRSSALQPDAEGSAWLLPLLDRIAARTAVVAVVGLGHVGLPLARAIATAGFGAIGLDTDPDRVAVIAGGGSPFRHLPAAGLAPLVRAGRLRATTDAAALAAADAVLIAVPTPLGADGTPDLGAVEAATRAAAAQLRPGTLLVLESTTWPGTTRQIVQPILEAAGLRVGHDVFLAYSPEREDPGNARFTTAAIPKLVAGADPASATAALALYGAVAERVVPVASLEAAEAAKLVENVFRSVNIALANELKLAFDALGVDVWEATAAAATKPFGYMPFWPGPGPGGHCIPVDPEYLSWAARRAGAPTPLIDQASAGNRAMPERVLARLAQGLRQRCGRSIAGSRILLVGVAYKRGIEDVRESPALRLIELIEAAGGRASFHDPYVTRLPAMAEHPQLAGRRGIAWSAPAIAAHHAALIVTDHDGVDYAGLLAHAPLVVDTRNVCARLGLTGYVLKA